MPALARLETLALRELETLRQTAPVPCGVDPVDACIGWDLASPGLAASGARQGD
ncbi:hypothetical protein [Pseudoxanthomonas sp. J35]|uniref:hypothetical protein n=1 Tax=Pseudoxanthomonas sp. J35 TaxID=935852 RepID=UPI0004BCD937|nr:hypothetical protein [Pseudoxanthomonas sp. J35]